jgi:hypothetical protein
VRPQKPRTDPQPSRYYHSDRALYRVEATIGSHVVVEDCRDGQLIGVPVADLRRWTPLDSRAPAPQPPR